MRTKRTYLDTKRYETCNVETCRPMAIIGKSLLLSSRTITNTNVLRPTSEKRRSYSNIMLMVPLAWASPPNKQTQGRAENVDFVLRWPNFGPLPFARCPFYLSLCAFCTNLIIWLSCFVLSFCILPLPPPPLSFFSLFLSVTKHRTSPTPVSRVALDCRRSVVPAAVWQRLKGVQLPFDEAAFVCK